MATQRRRSGDDARDGDAATRATATQEALRGGSERGARRGDARATERRLLLL
jgi:hypothetical protein